MRTGIKPLVREHREALKALLLTRNSSRGVSNLTLDQVQTIARAKLEFRGEVVEVLRRAK